MVFSILFLFVFIYLGFWQLERGAQKTAWIEEDKQRRLQPGSSLSELPEGVSKRKRLDGQPVQLQGSYEDEILFLLDNRVLRGEVGFEVLVPFRDVSGRVVLINRGFVPQGRTRLDKPQIPPLRELGGTLIGNIYVPDSGAGLRSITQAIVKLGNGSADVQAYYVVQSLDTEIMAEALQQTLFPHVVRLAELNDNALPRHWPLITMLPERHYGYALTWFLMAVTVAIAFMTFTFRTNTLNQRR